MLSIETIKDIFEQHNGIMRTQELHKARIYYNDIQRLIESGVIEKIRYGYYQWIDNENLSEATTVTRLFPDAIMCMDTALATVDADFLLRQTNSELELSWHKHTDHRLNQNPQPVNFSKCFPGCNRNTS